MADSKEENKVGTPDEKPAETAQKPKKVVQKPLNPLASKPGQNYGTTKFKD